MATDLLLGRAPASGPPWVLVLGDDGTGGPAPTVNSAQLGFTLAGITLTPEQLSAARPIGLSGQAVYDNRVVRYLVGAATAPHQAAAKAISQTSSAWGVSAVSRTPRTTAWQRAQRAGSAQAVGNSTANLQRYSAKVLYSIAKTVAHAAKVNAQAGIQQRRTAAGHWQIGVAAAITRQIGQQAGVPLRRWLQASAWQPALRAGVAPAGRLGASPHRIGVQAQRHRWQHGRYAPSGARIVVVVPPAPNTCYVPSTLIVLGQPWSSSLQLVFECDVAPNQPPPALLSILPARFYMTVHDLQAHRLPDLMPIPIYEAALSADVGSFAWQLGARGPRQLFDALAPSSGLPTQIRITLDGAEWVFVVDSLTRELSFGSAGVRVAGRSATALLGQPFARQTSRGSAAPANAQQLAAAALDLTGATLDWGLTDWLVPAGAWSHIGTPLAAVQAIVEAAGGYVQSHRSAATLLARHPYPLLPGGVQGGPWNWAGAFAADVELAPDSLDKIGIERRDGPDINGVYVSGQTQGVLALVKRTGTAADKLAPLVVDPLITASEAAEQRGLAIVGAGGPKHLVRIDIPVLTGAGQPGVLDVGQLVQINEPQPWRGRVRGVTVNAALPKVRQTITIERHLEAAP